MGELDICCTQLGIKLAAYNLGRRVTRLSQADFSQHQMQAQPYPYPLQQHALVAITLEHPSAPFEPAIWCLKLPLDEQGCIDFPSVHHIAGLLQNSFNHAVDGEERESMLKNNPFAISPSQQQLALLTSLIRKDKKQPASKYYEQVAEYFSGQTEISQWQNLSLQGIADLATRRDAMTFMQAEQLNRFPPEAIAGFAAAAEQTGVSSNQAEQISIALMAEKDLQRQLLYVRCILHPENHNLLEKALDKLLTGSLGAEPDLYILIAGRGWELLKGQNLKIYLERLAALEDIPLFVSLLTDLFGIPSLKAELHMAIRSPERSAELANAIGHFFKAVRG
ncbi:DUF3549 family protein [Corallincola platygyrae]|uniref:DUF3549 family protein n=1 Tax=Corallincola platygyrae TaxID=1193278 RepID=A0ABW4XQK4_9GAMM